MNICPSTTKLYFYIEVHVSTYPRSSSGLQLVFKTRRDRYVLKTTFEPADDLR
jgi:hypothetical protein